MNKCHAHCTIFVAFLMMGTLVRWADLPWGMWGEDYQWIIYVCRITLKALNLLSMET
jgi:hypothetical protein